MKRLLALVYFISIVFSTHSQLVTKTISDRSNGTLKKEILDDAVIRCLYERNQIYTDNGKTGYAIDTLMLDLGKRYSFFYDANKIYRDSLVMAFTNSIYQDLRYIYTKTKPEDFQELRTQGGRYMEKNAQGESVRLYKDRKNQNIISIDYEGTLYAFKLSEKIPPQQWIMTEDTLTVLGYLCQKAVATFRGRNYKAWFTPEIPINEGPWKLYGLPGLILKACTEDNLFSFTAIGIERLTDPVKITMNKDEYIQCDRKEMEKIHKKNQTSSRLFYFKDGNSHVATRNETWIFEPLEQE